MTAVSIFLFAAATLGLGVLGLQLFVVWRYLREPIRKPTKPIPAFSILKPLCGLDDALTQNLESFAAITDVQCEVLLGFKSPNDPAVPIARAFVERRPDRFRIVFQEGEPGLNPKVNQLITLGKAAKYDIIMVSDASIRAMPGYLPEIAAWLEDPTVGLVTHSVAGAGEKTLGALFDNIYIMTHISTGSISTHVTAKQDMVLGKSMAFRRADLAGMGGFEAVKDYLAEDFYLGRWVKEKLGKRVVIGRMTPETICERRTVKEFFVRYARWAVLQRKGVGVGIYCLQLLTYPIVLTTVALLLTPSWWALSWWVGVAATKAVLDLLQARLFRSDFPLWTMLVMPLNDLVIGWFWFHGLRYDRVEWRGNLFEVVKDTRLVPIHRPGVAAQSVTSDEPAGAEES